jgi:hypothetical protein
MSCNTVIQSPDDRQTYWASIFCFNLIVPIFLGLVCAIGSAMGGMIAGMAILWMASRFTSRQSAWLQPFWWVARCC